MYIFGGDTGWDYETVQKKRELANTIRAGLSRAPRNVGEGLTALGNALAVRGIEKRADKAERTGREKASELFSSLIGGGKPAPHAASTGPLTVIGVKPTEEQEIGGEAMAALGKAEFTPGDPASFTAAMMPYAKAAAEKTGLDPRLIVAQAALETGYGKSAPGNNYFGIKSHGKPGGNVLATNEVVNGQTVSTRDSFRDYGGMGESVNGYVDFLTSNPRYKDMLAAEGLDAQLAALGASGYATDPEYAAKVGAIARGIGGEQPPQKPSPQAAPARPDNAQLYAALNNPWLDKTQKAVILQMIEQNDPLRQMQLEKAQIELDRMRNPKPGFSVLTNDEEAELGLPTDGAYQRGADGKIYQIGGGGTNITLKNEGTIPQGYMAQRDEQGNLIGYTPVPGGPEDTSAKDAVAESNASTATAVITSAAERARAAAEQRDFGHVGTSVVGMLPWTDSAEVLRQVEVLKSNAKIENLNAMRAASPTGGALGSVTEKESDMLAAKSGALDPNSPNFLRDLEDYERTLLRIVHGDEAGDRIFEQTRGGGWQEINGVKVREKR